MSLPHITPRIALLALCPLALLAAPSHAQRLSTHIAVRPVLEDSTGTLIVDGQPVSVPMTTVWKPDCASHVDQATFEANVDEVKALPPVQPTFAPTSTQGHANLANLDLQLSLAGATPAQTAAVTAVESWLEANVRSSHASAPAPISISFAPLAGSVGMVTTQALYLVDYDNIRAIIVTAMDGDDFLQKHLPIGSLPVRTSVANSNTTAVTGARVTGAWVNCVVSGSIIPGTVATITVNSNFAYDYDPTDGVTAGQLCFRSALAHEIAHALGFNSSADDNLEPQPLDYYRFQQSSNNPLNYNGFTNLGRLMFNNQPANDDVEVDFMTHNYRMSDGNPNQASHFFEQTPSLGAMDPVLSGGETNYPNYLKESDLRSLDMIGYDWDDPTQAGEAHCTSITRIDENPTAAQTVRWGVQFDKRVVNLGAGDFEVSGIAGATPVSLAQVPGNAVHLDGQNHIDLQNCPPMTQRGQQAFTFECWIKPQQLGIGLRRNIAAFGSTNVGQGLGIYLDTSHRATVEASGLGYLWSSPNLDDGNWHHIAVVSSGGALAPVTLYVDFVARGTNIIPLNLQSGAAVIGRTLSGTAFNFFGDIDDVRFWDGAQSPATLSANARKVLPASTPGLRICYPFDVLTNLGFGGFALDTPEETLTGFFAEAVGLTPVTLVPGTADSGRAFILTGSTGTGSGGVIARFADFDTVLEARSGAPVNGPGISSVDGEIYTVNHASGFTFCEGTACPCGNNPTAGTNVGCRSSVGTGGKLRATGSPSLANDTITLFGSDMPATASAIYYQTEATSAPFVIDDGVSCVGGTLIRLRLQTNVSGSSQYPRPGGIDLPVSQRGSVTVPGTTRYYSCFYRNAASTFCTAATSNRTNAIGMTWN